MELKHLNMVVRDVQKAKTFFEKYFDMTCFVNAGKQFVAMHDENHFVFNLIYGDDFKYPKELHIGFPQKSIEDVDATYERLTKDGYASEEPTYTHNAYTFYFMSPAEFTIEIYHDVNQETKLKMPDYFKE